MHAWSQKFLEHILKYMYVSYIPAVKKKMKVDTCMYNYIYRFICKLSNFMHNIIMEMEPNVLYIRFFTRQVFSAI